MIGILGGMGTQAGLDFCNKLAVLNRGKIDQEYPLFILYNKSNIPGRPESIGVHTGKILDKSKKSIVIQITALRRDIDKVSVKLKSLGLVSASRTGAVAMTRGAEVFK